MEPDVDNESDAESEAEPEGTAKCSSLFWPSLIANL